MILSDGRRLVTLSRNSASGRTEPHEGKTVALGTDSVASEMVREIIPIHPKFRAIVLANRYVCLYVCVYEYVLYICIRKYVMFYIYMYINI